VKATIKIFVFVPDLLLGLAAKTALAEPLQSLFWAQARHRQRIRG
jgi:hypothetical protein